jgi:hypothetical protein
MQLLHLGIRGGGLELLGRLPASNECNCRSTGLVSVTRWVKC